MAIVTRVGKGSELTFTEMDNNFTELDAKTKNVGTKQVDETSIGNNKILIFDETANKLKYVSFLQNTVKVIKSTQEETISLDFSKDTFIKLDIATDIILTGSNIIPGNIGRILVKQTTDTNNIITFDTNIFLPLEDDLAPASGVNSITQYNFTCYSDNQVLIQKMGAFTSELGLLVNSNGDVLELNSNGVMLNTGN